LIRRCSCLAIAVVVVACAPPRGAAGPSLAITHVSVIDARDSFPRADHTVIVRGNRVVAAGPARSLGVPAGATVIDGRGRFLMPGLWDMHVHTDVPAGREVLALYVRNGITGVRDMAGRWDVIRAWSDSIGRGRLVGPRIVASGPYLEGGDTPIPHLLTRDPAEAHAAVD
jgi:predicted amidohydrolase YtcJ